MRNSCLIIRNIFQQYLEKMFGDAQLTCEAATVPLPWMLLLFSVVERQCSVTATTIDGNTMLMAMAFLLRLYDDSLRRTLLCSYQPQSERPSSPLYTPSRPQQSTADMAAAGTNNSKQVLLARRYKLCG